MSHDTQILMLCLLPLLLQLFGLLFAVLLDPFMTHRRQAILIIIIVLVASFIIQNYLNFLTIQSGAYRYLRILASIYGYIIRPIVLILFIRLIRPDGMQWPMWTLIGVNSAVHLTALFSGICFTINTENHFVRGPLGYTCHVISFALLLWLFLLSILEYRRIHKSETIIPVINAVIIVAGVALDMNVGQDYVVSFLTVSVVSSCVFYYLWLHLQFAREHEQALQAEQRIRIMISQIQPHFLFNTLTTIQALCRVNPEKAAEVTEKFAIYLRQNIDSLAQPSLIPLEKELEHTQVYAEIEMIRFPHIRVEYDIQDKDFSVPALTIQPLVENAIRHGVRVRKEGIVKVRTYRDGTDHILEIEDNGKGFDPEAVLQKREAEAETGDRSHIGLTNVRDRVQEMLFGSFHIDSRIDEGTKITIRIPEDQENKETDKTVKGKTQKDDSSREER